MITDQVPWAAGLFDGEGYLYEGTKAVSPSSAGMSLTDADLVIRFRLVMGFGRVHRRVFSAKKPAWVWRTTKQEHVQALIAAFWPFFSERRRRKATEVLKHGDFFRYKDPAIRRRTAARRIAGRRRAANGQLA